MSHPNLLEDRLLSSRPLVDGSPSVVRAFTDCFRAPHDTGITPKSFYLIIHRCQSVTALTVAQIILSSTQNARPHVLRGFRYPTFSLLMQAFWF
jgi:hypothetical protein